MNRKGLVAAGLLACGLAAFAPNLNSYFLADDFVLLAWTHPDSVRHVLDFFDPNTFWFYRPLVKLYYWLGQTIFGLHAAPFHFFSLILHGINGYLLYRLVARLPGTSWATGLAAGLIFLLDPHHAETVSWVAATGDLVAGFCILGNVVDCQVRMYQEVLRALFLW